MQKPPGTGSQTNRASRRGAVGVIVHESRLLTIRRSAIVRAPGKVCFPGGEIESGEASHQTVIREVAEELGLRVTPIRQLWTCTTSWNVHLTWWQCRAADIASISPNADEVSEYFWVTLQELADFPDLLESNREFLAALSRGEVRLTGIEVTSES